MIIGLALFYLFLRTHGLDIKDFIKNLKILIPVRASKIQNIINGYNEEYEAYLKYKAKLMPVFNGILSDSDAPEHIKAITSNYLIQMNAIEKENKAFLKRANQKIFIAHTQDYMLGCLIKLRRLNIEFEDHIRIIKEREYKEQEERYRQSFNQQFQSREESVSSYFSINSFIRHKST